MKKFGLSIGVLELRRFWRRALVVVLYAVYSGVLIFWASSPHPPPGLLIPLTQWVSVIGFALMAAIVFVLYIATGGVSDVYDHDLYPNKKPSPLDERQEKVRNRAYLPAYLILGPSLLVLVPSAKQIPPLQLITLGLFLYATLPIVVLAWLEPDPITDISGELRKKAL